MEVLFEDTTTSETFFLLPSVQLILVPSEQMH